MMGTQGVVVMDPDIELLLRTGLGVKDAIGKKLCPQAPVKALDPSRSRGRERGG